MCKSRGVKNQRGENESWIKKDYPVNLPDTNKTQKNKSKKRSGSDRGENESRISPATL